MPYLSTLEAFANRRYTNWLYLLYTSPWVDNVPCPVMCTWSAEMLTYAMMLYLAVLTVRSSLNVLRLPTGLPLPWTTNDITTPLPKSKCLTSYQQSRQPVSTAAVSRQCPSSLGWIFDVLSVKMLTIIIIIIITIIIINAEDMICGSYYVVSWKRKVCLYRRSECRCELLSCVKSCLLLIVYCYTYYIWLLCGVVVLLWKVCSQAVST